MTMQVLTRCSICLRLSQPTIGRCIFDNDSCANNSATEDRAKFLMTCHGYRLNRNYLWLVENDDPDNFQEKPIGAFVGTWADAFRVLIQHNFPTSEDVICGNCGTNEVEFLGDDCYQCGVEARDWQKAGEFV